MHCKESENVYVVEVRLFPFNNASAHGNISLKHLPCEIIMENKIKIPN